jgi:hydroxymethylpyrimidine/phosphomethylpyrimidine kinase
MSDGVKPPLDAAVKVALSIAGSDSGGGAGIQADLKTFAAFGVYGTTAITAITAQNTLGVDAVQEMNPRIVVAQIDAVAADFPVAAVKTGMLATAPIVLAVAAALERLRLPHLVVDPVMVSKSGAVLLRPQAVEALRMRLLPLAEMVTPNIPEAERISGISITDEASAREAARRIAAHGARTVLLKGGHAAGAEAIDLFHDGRVFETFRGPRLETRNTHGTGCTLSAAIAALLALGSSPLEAAFRAKAWLSDAIASAPGLGKGTGPVDHFVAGIPAKTTSAS